ncbi:MAG: hypothetical protein PHI34_09100 [Acidobacteriota bacterium]|nr:hypothetical protein [Acidobacteriota bacterium]
MNKMGIRRRTGALGLAILCGIIVSSLMAGPDDRAAIVCFLEGQARVSDGGASLGRELQLFDWLKAGSVVETAAESRMVVAFAQGDRYELKGKAKATLTANGFASASGTLIKLDSVPVVAQVLALSADSKPGSRLTAIRLRGSNPELAGLYPAEGAAVLADEAALSFALVEGVEKYRVELEDAWGNKLLSVETASPGVALSPGILKPGAGYYWSVRTLDKIKLSKVADAEFVTLSEDQAKIRKAFQARARASKDAAQLLLLARLDSALNLRREACATLREAQALFPQNAEIKKAMDRMDCR